MAVALKTIYRQQDVPSPEEFQKSYIRQFGPEPIDAIYHLYLEEDEIFTFFFGSITVFMHGDNATVLVNNSKYSSSYIDFIRSNCKLSSMIVYLSFYRFSWTLNKMFFRKIYFDYPFIRFSFMCMSTYLRDDIERSIIKILPFIVHEDEGR
ncbi:hypothetical protein [Insolitispirillum peregrinum]|uniref:hypothetical protein n=1 Tax=Insolitispirillum peregrinum TaxID=80876 RepID=UPI00360E3355